MLTDGRGLGSGYVVEPCLIKGGYLFLPCDNGMQTGEARTIKRHFWGDEEAGREIIMQSVPVGGHCSPGGLQDPPVCSHVDVRPGQFVFA